MGIHRHLCFLAFAHIYLRSHQLTEMIQVVAMAWVKELPSWMRPLLCMLLRYLLPQPLILNA